MIALFTDFGPNGPYVGQVKAVLVREAPAIPVIDLMNDVPPFNPRAAAYLLPALVPEFPAETVFLCVIDPGVGTRARDPVVGKLDGRWFVGPDNGLFHIVARRATEAQWWRITWQPLRLSHTFHGRDLFAPVAAVLARGEGAPGQEIPHRSAPAEDWPDDLYEVIYIDGFGNAVTGIRAATLDTRAVLSMGGTTIQHGLTYGEVGKGEAFWHENSNGLVELAVNRGSVARQFELKVGFPISRIA